MNYANIAEMAKQNSNFRTVLWTGEHSQLVLMSIQPGEDIGMEVHHVDQVLVFVEGEAKAYLDGNESEVKAGDLFIVPAGKEHNFTNTGSSALKLYTLYAPAEHADGTVHVTRAEAMEAEALEHGHHE